MSKMYDVHAAGSLREPSDWNFYAVEATPKPSLFSVQLLRDAAMSLVELRRVSHSFQARDLVALLKCHAARKQRVAMPKATIHMKTCVMGGRQAVRIVLK
ncbi:hypothetical protein [Paenochrobactrum glaciei]|uniref:Uncharacterized protein n=1 Tax=Paenochrobactrum glaciei TaxID=486407 RepID=A0ABN1FGA7_9HYPH